MYVKSNLKPFWQKPSGMEVISQIIRSVGLFVPSSPEVTISTKNQPFLYLLKNGLIEVPAFVYSLPNCWEMVSECWVTEFVIKHNRLSLKTIFIHLYFWKWPYFSIAYARNFGLVTSLIGHDPFCVCEFKPQPLLTEASKYGGDISNNKVCWFICFK